MDDKLTKHSGREFSSDQTDLIKRTIAKGASNDELALFLNQCKRTGLDPFTRQIYFTKRRQMNRASGQWEEIGTTQTGIDGFRVIAERTEEYDGTETSWCGSDGIWKDVWLEDNPPAAARVIAFRKGCPHAFTGIAKWREYVQTNKDGHPMGLWVKMPANQLAKCAEALALRKAYPNDLSGLYTTEEMGQADADPEAQAAVIEAQPVTPFERLSEDQQARVTKMFAELKTAQGLQTAKLNEFLGKTDNVDEGFEALLEWGKTQYRMLKKPVEIPGGMTVGELAGLMQPKVSEAVVKPEVKATPVTTGSDLGF